MDDYVCFAIADIRVVHIVWRCVSIQEGPRRLSGRSTPVDRGALPLRGTGQGQGRYFIVA